MRWYLQIPGMRSRYLWGNIRQPTTTLNELLPFSLTEELKLFREVQLQRPLGGKEENDLEKFIEGRIKQQFFAVSGERLI